MEAEREKKRVLVAFSGGVDSTAAALLLRAAGYEVSAASLLLGGESAEAARASAEELGLPFACIDAREAFRREVQDRFVADYCAGYTPNPCLVCNRTMKFGLLLDRALALGYDALATGHYARVVYDGDAGRYRLLRGRDRRKDQSYVLYQLTQRQLKHLLLPVGEYDKESIRALAERAGLSCAQRRDSQDICFIPDGDYVRFLRDYGGVTPEPGDFTDASGRVLGRHRGLVAYTTGQRKGLGVSADRPLYVLRKNAADNTVLLGGEAELYSRTLTAERVNWIGGAPTGVLRCTAKTRYSQRESACSVTLCEDGCVRVEFDEPQRAVTAGQAVVFYDGEECLGGGTIASSSGEARD